MSSSLIYVSDPLYSLIHANTNTGGTFQGLHGVNDQVVGDVVESCCDVAIHHENWYPPLVCLLHHAAQDEDHLMGLTARDMAVLWAVPGVDCLARQLFVDGRQGLRHFIWPSLCSSGQCLCGPEGLPHFRLCHPVPISPGPEHVSEAVALPSVVAHQLQVCVASAVELCTVRWTMFSSSGDPFRSGVPHQVFATPSTPDHAVQGLLSHASLLSTQWLIWRWLL